MFNEIKIQGARLHNLKNISLNIPKNKLVVFTGLSGSGKSTLVFDTIHKEGQRQYLESLGMVTDDLAKPAVDRISGLSPTISVDQHLTNRSPRSTVGTATEIFTYLRILYARIGTRLCPQCGSQIQQNYADIDDSNWNSFESEEDSANDASESIICSKCGHTLQPLSMTDFSFNKSQGACPTCMGLGEIHRPVITNLINTDLSIPDGAISGWDIHYIQHYSKTLKTASAYYDLHLDLNLPIKEYSQPQKDLLIYGVESQDFARHFPGKPAPATVSKGRFEGVATNILRRYTEQSQNTEYRDKLKKLVTKQICLDCAGSRLKVESRQVTIQGISIVELVTYALDQLHQWLQHLPGSLSEAENHIVEPLLVDMIERLEHLMEVGIGYLSLNRASTSLSGGEAQRLRLASLLGSGLTGVIYVMDEPTLGLHPRDTENLLKFITRLRDLGNSMLVIEHDLDVYRKADYLIDIGPKAGKDGGHIVASGTPQEIAAHPTSITAQYLNGNLKQPIPKIPRRLQQKLEIFGAAENNLKNLDVSIPLGGLVAITGVSGSGKSSLIIDILQRAANHYFNGSKEEPGKFERIDGWHYLDKVISVDQKAIGRIPRSNAATYTGTFDNIRAAFASTPDAKQLKLKDKHFSFNTRDGACPHCKGSGELTVKMHFLPDTSVKCPQCQGKRYKKKILAVSINDKNIADILEMTISEAAVHFKNYPAVVEKLHLLEEVGLGYLQLGQPATTLSGGEAQRVKLSRELSRKASGKTLYLLDEPTMGLHAADTTNLILLLQRLVDAGNSVVVIEHNLELIQCADWIIDLGPEGGEKGGRIIAEGTPQAVAAIQESYTGQALKSLFETG
ncbi:MAG: excinuclease ABC subunit UvrA [Anaerolineaceae bacterium]|nr:excinuclease ABC subunit UvrA [Anaerolineaceae bacterium]